MITDKILYSTEAKIKDVTALIVLEDGSTLIHCVYALGIFGGAITFAFM